MTPVLIDRADESRDPNYSDRLQTLGIVSPNPFFALTQQPNNPQQSDPSAPGFVFPPHNNPALMILKARESHSQAQQKAETKRDESEANTMPYLSVQKIQEAIRLRNEGANLEEIEELMRLQSGALKKLGKIGAVDVI
jgi:hypothetical protein